MTYEARAIIWDLDGTLLNSYGIYTDIIGKVVPEYGLPMPSEEVLRSNYHGRLEETLQATFDINSVFARELVNEFLVMQNPYYEDLDGHFYPDALGLLSRIGAVGVPQLMITNRSHAGHGHASPRNLIIREPLKGFISHVLCGDDNATFCKPDPRIVEPLLERLGVKPHELVLIGDQFVDAQLAQNLGAKAVLVNRNGVPPHLDKLTLGWEDHVTIVPSLDAITITKTL